jgi:alpha-2-macroglobulin
VGDYVRVTVRVAVPGTRRFVVVEDPIPAGLEPMNFEWLTESQRASQALGEAQGPLDHGEQRDTHVMFSANQLEPGLYQYVYLARANTPGKFLVPPARAAEMYHPETFGRTARTEFEVVAP